MYRRKYAVDITLYRNQIRYHRGLIRSDKETQTIRQIFLNRNQNDIPLDEEELLKRERFGYFFVVEKPVDWRHIAQQARPKKNGFQISFRINEISDISKII